MAAALSSGNVTPAQLTGRRFFIVADLTIGGAQILAATAELEIPWAVVGRTLSASHGLSRPVEVTLDAGWGKAQNAPPEATLELPLSGRLLELRRAGALGSGIRCEVFLWVEGSDYTAREVLVTGAVRLTSLGADGEAVIFNVRQDTGRDTAPVPLGLLDDSESSIPSSEQAVAANLGRSYPLVFGPYEDASAVFAYKPKRSEAVAFSETTGTAGTVLRLAIAGHRVEAQNVLIVDSENGSTDLPVVYRQDASGRTFATVNLLGAGLEQAEGTTYTVKWTKDGGALIDEGRVVVGAGHLISYLMRVSGLPVDLGRLASVRAALDAYNVAGTIQEPVGALEYIGDALASVLPFTLTIGPQGWWAWPWPLAPGRSEALTVINPERGDVARSSELILDSGAVVNDLELAFAVDQASGDMTRRLRAGASDAEIPLGDCINSQAAYGVRSESLESVVIERRGSAARALVARLTALAMPRARVSYDLATAYAWLRPRQLVMLQDADVGAYGVAVIDGMILSELGLNATLLILTPTGDE